MPGPLMTSVAGARPAHSVISLLGSLWEKYLPLMHERLVILDATIQAIERGELTAGQRHEALDAAHKFAGSLGMFGFDAGTDAARAIEHLLLEDAPYDAACLRKLVNTLHEVLDLQ